MANNCAYSEESPGPSGRLLFLEGSPGSGKSSLLVQALAEHRPVLNGYVTKRCFDKSGGFMGFAVISAAQAASMTLGREAHQNLKSIDAFLNHGRLEPGEELFLDMRGGHPAFDTGLYLRQIRALCAYPEADLTVLDELGGTELLHDELWIFLSDLLLKNRRFIIVYKSDAHVDKLSARMGLAPGALSLLRERRRILYEQPESLHLDVSRSREQAALRLNSFTEVRPGL